MANTQTVTPPVAYPTVNIRGIDYIVKFGLGAMYRMESLGLDMARLREQITAEVEAGRSTQLTFKLLAATLGRQTEKGWEPLGLAPEKLADLMGDDVRQLAVLAEAVKAALVKAQPAETTAQTPPAEPVQ